MTTKVINLDAFGIKISWDGKDRGGASITTDLKLDETKENRLYNAAIDGIESMILAQFCAGLDVTTPAYLESIKTSVNALANNMDEDVSKLEIFVHLDGGLIHDVYCNDTFGLECEITVCDFDTDGVLEDELSNVTLPDQDEALAYLTKPVLIEGETVIID